MPEFLTNLASFCHDRLCSSNIIEIIKLYKTEVKNSVKESNDLIHVYFIASLLFQIGQSLHEYSDFVKNESLKAVFKDLYKIFRNDIYFYSHYLKYREFLIEFVNLFE